MADLSKIGKKKKKRKKMGRSNFTTPPQKRKHFKKISWTQGYEFVDLRVHQVLSTINKTKPPNPIREKLQNKGTKRDYQRSQRERMGDTQGSRPVLP
jgi:hypothetical protein